MVSLTGFKHLLAMWYIRLLSKPFMVFENYPVEHFIDQAEAPMSNGGTVRFNFYKETFPVFRYKKRSLFSTTVVVYGVTVHVLNDTDGLAKVFGAGNFMIRFTNLSWFEFEYKTIRHILTIVMIDYLTLRLKNELQFKPIKG